MAKPKTSKTRGGGGKTGAKKASKSTKRAPAKKKSAKKAAKPAKKASRPAKAAKKASRPKKVAKKGKPKKAAKKASKPKKAAKKASKPKKAAKPDKSKPAKTVKAPAAENAAKAQAKRADKASKPKKAPKLAAKPAAPAPKPTAASPAVPLPNGPARLGGRIPAGAEELKARLGALSGAIARIKQLKRGIENNFYDIGQILEDIKDRRLYEVKGYGSFDAFVEREVDLGKQASLRAVRVVQTFVREAVERVGFKRASAALAALDGEEQEEGQALPHARAGLPPHRR